MKSRQILATSSGVLALLVIIGIGFNRPIQDVDKSDEQKDSGALQANRAQSEAEEYHEKLLQLRHVAKAKAEEHTAEQREEWKRNFPWKPTRDPDVVVTQKIIDSGYAEAMLENHSFLKGFFQNEARFTPQFQKFYEIVSEYGRDDNPVAIGQSFQNLWDLHEALTHDPEEVLMNADGTQVTYIEPWEPSDAQKPLTYGIFTKKIWGSIGSFLHRQGSWPEKDPEQLPPPEIQKVIHRLFTEVQGMDSIPDPGFAFNGDFQDELQVGDSPLVPRVGWQAAYDKWNEEVQNQPSAFAYLVDPTGESHAMIQDPNGNFINPLSAEQIEQINHNQSK